MRPTQVVPGVYQLHVFGVRVTALFGKEGIVLVDAGWRCGLRWIAAGLRALDASLDDVRLIVLTHHHPDHAGGLAKLAEATSSKVAVHRREASIINGEEPYPNPYPNRLLAGVTRPFLPLFYGDPVRVDYSLEDGAALPVPEEVRVIHTPGHTPGAICLYAVSKKVIIVGDALQYRSGRLELPASSVTQDPGQARESLKKLISVDFDVISFSHFPPLRRDAREALARLIQRTSR